MSLFSLPMSRIEPSEGIPAWLGLILAGLMIAPGTAVQTVTSWQSQVLAARISAAAGPNWPPPALYQHPGGAL